MAEVAASCVIDVIREKGGNGFRPRNKTGSGEECRKEIVPEMAQGLKGSAFPSGRLGYRAYQFQIPPLNVITLRPSGLPERAEGIAAVDRVKEISSPFSVASLESQTWLTSGS